MDSPRVVRAIDAAIFAVERVRRRLLDVERWLDDLGDQFRAPVGPRHNVDLSKATEIFKKVYAVKFGAS